ncbi:YkgJ family cysteine cluster protein [Phyllobacterium sp. P5_D12]
MRHFDTVDKIVQVYFASVCSRPFVYKGKEYKPKHITVSPLLVRGYTCPSGCGACCGSFSLDYLPSEEKVKNATPRTILFDGRSVEIFSDCQVDVGDRWCRNLERSSGRCSVYSERPMACDFELIRFLVYEDKVLLIQKQYGRAWAMERLDHDRGALCEMLPPSPSTIAEVIRKLKRLEQWADYFHLPTRIEPVIAWIKGGALTALHLDA